MPNCQSNLYWVRYMHLIPKIKLWNLRTHGVIVSDIGLTHDVVRQFHTWTSLGNYNQWVIARPVNPESVTIHQAIKTVLECTIRFHTCLSFCLQLPLCKFIWPELFLTCTAFIKSFLDNGVMKSPKRWNLISLVFTCLCISKSLLILFLLGHLLANDVLNSSGTAGHFFFFISLHVAWQPSAVHEIIHLIITSNKILESDWLSPAMIWAFNRTV